jgi:capsular exopolysaccharide synthesis family protein
MIETTGLRRDVVAVAAGRAAVQSESWRSRGTAAKPIDQHLVALVSPDCFEAEPYRILLSMLEGFRATRPAMVVAVTSAAPGDGKTTTSINLAGMLARLPGSRVLLLDADLRRPSVAQRLGLGDADDLGLATALRHPELVVSAGFVPCPELPLAVLATGSHEGLPFEALHSPAFGALMQQARETHRYVVVDTPPVVALPDARALASLVDGFLLVVRAGVTPRHLLAEALEALEPERVLGLVFNGDERPYAGYYSRYRSYYRTVRRQPTTRPR